MFLTPAFEASPGFTHLKLCSAVLLSFLRLVIIILALLSYGQVT